MYGHSGFQGRAGYGGCGSNFETALSGPALSKGMWVELRNG